MLLHILTGSRQHVILYCPRYFLSLGFGVYEPFALHQAGAFSFSIREEENEKYLPKKQNREREGLK